VTESPTVVTLCIRFLHVVPITTNTYEDGLHEILKIVINYGNKFLGILLNRKYGLFF